MIDLLVIGAGLTGLTAALTAARQGQQVRVIAKGMGAIHWYAGTIDLLGYTANQHAAVTSPFEQIAELPAQHPYPQLGAEKVRSAINTFVETLSAAGLSYATRASGTTNLKLPSPVGAIRPTLFAPSAQLAGNLADAGPMLLVGFDGMRDFYPQLIAENLRKQGHEARVEMLPINMISPTGDNHPVHLAESLDLGARRHHLGAALKKIVRSGERIGLPAILGLDQHALTFSELQNQASAPIFEIPTLPPSVPGIRLYRALHSELAKLKVRIESNMEVINFHATAQKLEWVETATSSRPLRHYARNFLLATGGILGGGFNSDHSGKVWEVVFHLPLNTPQDRRQWFQPRFLDERGHALFSGGVEVNQNWQPVDASGEVVYENLRAAGSLLAHADPIRERSLEGIAIATGTAAAEFVK